MIKEEQLLEQKEFRDKLASKVEVLEKIKSLLLIPQTEFANIKQVSDFYEVNESNIKMVYAAHKEEFKEDGVMMKSYKDFLKSAQFTLEMSKGKATLINIDNESFQVPMRGLRVFPRRAILRMGMLLRDSVIAKRVRTALLDIEEKTSNEIKMQDISEEQSLAMSLGMAQASGDITAITIATGNLMAFKNRHIKMQEEHINKLQNDNKALAGEILEWEDRSKINFAIRKLARSLNKVEGCIWTELYKDLKYKYHIDVKLRGEKPWIKHIKENEWDKVMKTFSALCEKNHVSPSSILGSLNGGQSNE